MSQVFLVMYTYILIVLKFACLKYLNCLSVKISREYDSNDENFIFIKEMIYENEIDVKDGIFLLETFQKDARKITRRLENVYNLIELIPRIYKYMYYLSHILLLVQNIITLYLFFNKASEMNIKNI